MQWLDVIIMALVICFLGFVLMYRAKLCSAEEKNPFFFDLNNTKAMRGFWCIVVVLVHIPAAYQNRIQDMIGSFAYVGVTFFFMASAFGLSEGIKKKPQSIRFFWRKRIPKLIVPNILINIIFGILGWMLLKEKVTFKSILGINAWVCWLILCNLVFWIVHKLIKNPERRDIAICGMIGMISIIAYWLRAVDGRVFASWETEIFGFAWGILLSRFYTMIQNKGKRKWIFKVVAIGFCAMVLGLAYLKYKPVFFWGEYLLKIILGIAILGLILILNTRIVLGNRVILYLGEISFEIYLIHGEIFKLVEYIAPGLSSGLYIGICLISVVTVSALVHLIVKHILNAMRNIPGF